MTVPADRPVSAGARVSRSLTAIPADAASHRSDAWSVMSSTCRDHVGLDRADLLGHSAGANVAVQFVAGDPNRMSRLVLITPSTRAVGLEAISEMRPEIMRPGAGEPLVRRGVRRFRSRG